MSVQKKINPYTKPSKEICYRCNGRGHRSNVCPTRRVIGVVEEKEEERVGNAIKNDGHAQVEFVEEKSNKGVNFYVPENFTSIKI